MRLSYLLVLIGIAFVYTVGVLYLRDRATARVVWSFTGVAALLLLVLGAVDCIAASRCETPPHTYAALAFGPTIGTTTIVYLIRRLTPDRRVAFGIAVPGFLGLAYMALLTGFWP